MKSLNHYWYSRNIIAISLLPLSWLFRFVARVRRTLYRAGILTSTALPVPVVIVGNISVGGTGKTPLLIALCELLKSYSHRPGVISRGYGADVSGVKLVTADSHAAEVGDEPLLIARRASCPVAVGRDRPAAAQYLLKHYDCTVLLSDDGLQHYALQRDIEIAVVDARRLHGNGYCLPAGPLREPASRLASVELVVYNGNADEKYNFLLDCVTAINTVTGSVVELKSFSGKRVHVVAGIGYPQRFFDQLAAMGIQVIPHAFPDHHAYVEDELDYGDELPVLMTEKDSVKCAGFDIDRLWYVPVNARLSEQLVVDFKRLVTQADGRKQ